MADEEAGTKDGGSARVGRAKLPPTSSAPSMTPKNPPSTRRASIPRAKPVGSSVSRAVAATPSSPPSIAEDGTAIEAERVDVRMSAVGRVDASDVSVSMGAIGAARADSITVDKGSVGAAMTGRLELSRGYARSILARQVQIDRGAARIIVAADVRAERTAVLFLVARKVSGDVRVLFDWRGALAFGAVAGIIAGVGTRLRGPR